ncbi:MAG: hypothetical protein JWP09_839 [Candidatus Taylorbacteria bacterium]|nr:hypothetical protein [Candidatus Taylorbacteria bacterium]
MVPLLVARGLSVVVGTLAGSGASRNASVSGHTSLRAHDTPSLSWSNNLEQVQSYFHLLPKITGLNKRNTTIIKMHGAVGAVHFYFKSIYFTSTYTYFSAEKLRRPVSASSASDPSKLPISPRRPLICKFLR